MKFNREAVTMGQSQQLEEGVYIVTIDDITRRTTQSGRELWNLTVKSADGKTSRTTFFDNGEDMDKFQPTKKANDVWLERMLASINDAGYPIPDYDYTFDNIDVILGRELANAKAFVKVTPQKNDPQYFNAMFITKNIYDKEIDKQADAAFGDAVDPFATATPVTDNPFA